MADGAVVRVPITDLPDAVVTRVEGDHGMLLVNLEPFAHAARSGTEVARVTVWRADDGRVVSIGVELREQPPPPDPIAEPPC